MRAQRSADRLLAARVAHLGHERLGLPARERALHDGPQQAFLGAEVPEDRAAADAGGLADRLHGRITVASLGEQARGGLDQALAGQLRLLTLAGRHRLGHSATVAPYADRPT